MTTKPHGDVIVTRHTNPGGLEDWLTIDRADPRARIGAGFIADFEAALDAEVERFGGIVGDVLTLRGRNRTVVYRIDWDDYDPQTDSYGMEWPD